jgi:hypothetical protein
MEPHVVNGESIGGLVRGILGDLRTLLREEMALARLEIKEQATQARTAAVSLGVAAVALLMGGAFMLVAVALAIADVFDWPLWTGFLIVAVVMSIVGAAAYSAGRKKLSTVHAVPEKTMSTIKENAEWISKRLSSAQR